MAAQKLELVSQRGGGRPAKISRDRILEVARQLGPGEFTFQHIAAKLGVRAAALYYHFPSRAELLNALALDLAKEFAAQPGNPKRWKSWLEKTALHFYDFLLSNHSLLHVDNWRGLAEFGEPIIESVLETLVNAGYSLDEAGRIWEVVGNFTYAEARVISDYQRVDPGLVGNAAVGNTMRPSPRLREWVGKAQQHPRERFAETLHWLIGTLPQPRS